MADSTCAYHQWCHQTLLKYTFQTFCWSCLAYNPFNLINRRQRCSTVLFIQRFSFTYFFILQHAGILLLCFSYFGILFYFLLESFVPIIKLFVPWYNGIDSHFIEFNNPLLILEFLSTFLSRLMTLF